MSKHGKKYLKAAQEVVHGVQLPIREGLQRVKKLAYAAFDETVGVSVNLGIDASKGEHATRGSVLLPHGRGKEVKVLVFAKGEAADDARKAGADYVGAEDLVEKINSGWMDFNYAVAHRDMTSLIAKVAKILGPRGLLPNQKLGTVTADVGKVVTELKKGLAFFKNDKNGIVHFAIGKVSFDVDFLHQNLQSFVKELLAVRPATVKGKFIKKITISSTMGIGIRVNADELLQA